MNEAIDLRGVGRQTDYRTKDSAEAWRAGWGKGPVEVVLTPFLSVFKSDPTSTGTVSGVRRTLRLTVKGSNPGRLEVVMSGVFKAPVQPDGSFKLDVTDGNREGHWKEQIFGRLTAEGLEIRRYDRVDFVQREGHGPTEVTEMYIASGSGPGVLTRR